MSTQTRRAPAALDPADWADRVLRAEHGAIARLLTAIERRSEPADEILARLHPSTGRAYVVGITGPAGSGKSTLLARLAVAYRHSGRTVAILAVDPSSTLTGGAILGDRIRMGELSGDRDIYIRSLATRGAMGGLSRAVLDGISVLDAAGFDVVIVETVGVGQAEVDVMSVAQSVVVVSVPGLGDDVQAIKAGLLEVADLHVVNKADLPGAARTVAEIRDVLRLAHRRPGQWNVAIKTTCATTNAGVEEVVTELERHRTWLSANGGRAELERRTAATRIRWAAEEAMVRQLGERSAAFARAVEDVVARRSDPAGAARDLLRRV